MKTRNSHNTYEAVLAVTFLLLLLQYFFFPDYPKLALATIAFVLLCLLSSQVAEWVAIAWSALTQGIGWVMNKVILSLVFFLLLTPLAIVYRFFKKNTFYKSSDVDSYFVDRQHIYQKKDIENPW